MISPEPYDLVDTLLREQNAYVEDAGFTERVLKSLPRRRRAWLRPALLLGATTFGSLLAVWWVPGESFTALDSSALLWPNADILLPFTFALAVTGSLIWSTVAALQGED
jgi:hypothetical protein